jgi:hypothetical protein
MRSNSPRRCSREFPLGGRCLSFCMDEFCSEACSEAMIRRRENVDAICSTASLANSPLALRRRNQNNGLTPKQLKQQDAGDDMILEEDDSEPRPRRLYLEDEPMPAATPLPEAKPKTISPVSVQWIDQSPR